MTGQPGRAIGSTLVTSGTAPPAVRRQVSCAGRQPRRRNRDPHTGPAYLVCAFLLSRGGLTARSARRASGGTASCTATVNGQPVTSPGRFGNTLQGVSNCTRGSFTGTFVLKIPTTTGEQMITGRFTEAVVAPFTAAFTGDLTGTVVSSVLLEGDCVTTPLTRSRS